MTCSCTFNHENIIPSYQIGKAGNREEDAMSIDINNENTATPAELEAEITDLRNTAEGLRSNYLSARREANSLQEKFDAFTKNVIDTLIYFVDDVEHIEKHVALDLFERWGLGVPTKTEDLTVQVVASGEAEVEIQVDEDDVSDKIDEELEDVIDSDWDIRSKYINLPTLMAEVTIERAVRDLSIQIESRWDESDDEDHRDDLIQDAIREEIGGGEIDWGIDTYKIL